MTPHDPTKLPPDLPVPIDDGTAAHIEGSPMPSVALPSTAGDAIDPSNIPGTLVLYVYPKAGRPGGAAPPPEWDEIPGARGCTPQSCAFRDHHGELKDLGAELIGLSTQSTAEQIDFVEHNHLPFPLLSDADLTFAKALDLPTFTFDDTTLLKRITLIADSGVITKVFYPVFPPDRNAEEVIGYLSDRRANR